MSTNQGNEWIPPALWRVAEDVNSYEKPKRSRLEWPGLGNGRRVVADCVGHDAGSYGRGGVRSIGTARIVPASVVVDRISCPGDALPRTPVQPRESETSAGWESAFLSVSVVAFRQRRSDRRMLIRHARTTDADAIWSIIRPVIRAGETYALDPDISETEALAYWLGTDKETFLAEENGQALGTYYIRANQGGGGRHVCNCGYMTALAATGQGVARRMCEHSLDHAKARGFRAMQFNFVVSVNDRAVRLWRSLGFEVVGRLPLAFDHPSLGLVDALVMFRAL